MARQLPLSKKRLHELLGLYEQRLTLEEQGGYDKGVYFSFRGKQKPEFYEAPPIGVFAGRIAGKFGFCSEATRISREELFHRDRSAGLAQFWRRVADRRATLERWLDQYYADRH